MLLREKSKNRDKIDLETFVQQCTYCKSVTPELGQAGWMGKGHRTLPESAVVVGRASWFPSSSPAPRPLGSMCITGERRFLAATVYHRLSRVF